MPGAGALLDRSSIVHINFLVVVNYPPAVVTTASCCVMLHKHQHTWGIVEYTLLIAVSQEYFPIYVCHLDKLLDGVHADSVSILVDFVNVMVLLREAADLFAGLLLVLHLEVLDFLSRA